MREIKFRLLNHNKKIVGYEKWNIGDFNMETKKDYYVNSPKWLYSTDGKYWNPDEIIHRYKDQFIGIKDANKKEIYENDILINKQENKFIILWARPEIDYCGWCAQEIGSSDRSLFIASRFNNSQIIGNIYEKTELLELK